MATQMAEWVIKFDDQGTPVLRKLEAGMERLDKSAARLNTGSRGLSQTLENFGKGFLAYEAFNTVKDGMIALGDTVIRNTAEFQKYQAVLANTYGSSKAASEAMALIQDVAVQTPFQITELTESFVKLSNRGFIPTKQEMIQLSDVASATGKGFDQLTEAMLDATVGQTRRLEELGFGIDATTDKYRISFKGQTYEVEKNGAALTKWLLSVGKMPGVMNSSAAQMKTLEGKLSNLKDNWDQMTIALGQNQDGLISWGVETLSGAVVTLKNMVTTTDQVNRKLGDEQWHLRELQMELTSTKTSEERRLEIMRELKREYPEYLQGIEAEARNINKVSDAIDKQIEKIGQKIVFNAREKQAQDILKGGWAKLGQGDYAAFSQSYASKAAELERKVYSTGPEGLLYGMSGAQLERGKGVIDRYFGGFGSDKKSPLELVDIFSQQGYDQGITLGKFSREFGQNSPKINDMVKMARSAREMHNIVADIQTEFDKFNKDTKVMMEALGFKQDKSALGDIRGNNKNPNLDPGGITTSITSAAPKILTVNIDTVHRGNNTIVVKREDIGRQVREEIKRANLEALSDSTILAGWSGE